jgi:hypothetical protein
VHCDFVFFACGPYFHAFFSFLSDLFFGRHGFVSRKLPCLVRTAQHQKKKTTKDEQALGKLMAAAKACVQ